MQVTCSNCQSKIRVPDSAAGKKGKCPKCGNVIAIPTLDAPAEEPAAEATPGSPFDFGSDEPPPARKSSRKTDDAVEADAPPRKSKARAADDEEVVDAANDYEDEGDRPRRIKKSEESIGLSVTSLVLGIVSLLSGTGGGCCCGIFSTPVTLLLAIGALVTGFIGMKKGGKVMAIIGMSLGGVGLILFVVWLVLGIIALVAGGAANAFRFNM